MNTQIAKNQLGVTLVELMVALAISSIILLGVSTVFVGSKRNYAIQDEFGRLQENARYTMDRLATSIRDAGNTGCSSGTLGVVTNTLNNSDDIDFNFEVGLEGYEATGTGPNQTITLGEPPTVTGTASGWVTAGPLGPLNVDAAIAALAIDGSDILAVRTTTGTGVEVVANNNAANVFIEDLGTVANACPSTSMSVDTTSYSGLCEEDILLLSDCEKSFVFQATGLGQVGVGPTCNGATVNCTKLNHDGGSTIKPPGNDYSSWDPSDKDEIFGPGAEIMKVTSLIYFIGIGANGGPALFVQNGAITATNPPLELVEGVENMQILYGIDTNNDEVANQFVTADNVPLATTNMFDNVVSVKLSLLIRTVNNTSRAAQANTYLLGGVAAATALTVTSPTDQRIRKVFSSTIKLRNRGVAVALSL